MNEAKNFNAEIPLAKWAKGIIKCDYYLYYNNTHKEDSIQSAAISLTM